MFEKPTEEPVHKPYRKLQVDDLPIIETHGKLNYKILLEKTIRWNMESLLNLLKGMLVQ